MNASLAAHSIALGGVSGQLAGVAQQQADIAVAAEGGLAALQQLGDRTGGLDAKMQHSLLLQASEHSPAGAPLLAPLPWHHHFSLQVERKQF